MKLEDLNKEDLPTTEMCDIARKHGTDKFQHGYTKVYFELMKDKRYTEISIFEIGIFKGNSLRLWHEFFPKGRVYGSDNGRLLPNSSVILGSGNQNPSEDDKRLLEENAVVADLDFKWIENERIKCAIADQRSNEQLQAAFKYFGCEKFDYIIDDAQHYQEHQQKTLGLLFANVKPGGYYIVEDVCDYRELFQNNKYWGQKRADCTDCTDYVFEKYMKDGVLESDYMTPEQIQYVTHNIADIFMYDCFHRNNSPINGSARLLVLKKK